MLKDSIYSAWIAFIVCIVLCPIMIPILHKLKFGQNVRDDGPKTHLKKSGTPTMGGIMIIAAIIVSSLIFIPKYPRILPVLLMTVGFGFIGFVDDYLKVVKKKSEGLKVWQKLFMQLIMTSIFAYYLFMHKEIGSSILVPFTGTSTNGLMLNLGILYIPFVYMVVLGTDNGVNFTDGLDGLCSSVTIIIAIFFAIAAMLESSPVAPIAAAVVGSLLAFLFYNTYPAKVFMGDTGSLALGGFISSYALTMRYPIFILIVGFVYFMEVLSVIMQVGYFKATKGKRIFRMAPIHHHFELGGMEETRVVMMFVIVTVLLCSTAYVGLII